MAQSKAKFLVLIPCKVLMGQSKASKFLVLIPCKVLKLAFLVMCRAPRRRSIILSRTTEEPAFVPADFSLVCEEKERFGCVSTSTRERKKKLGKEMFEQMYWYLGIPGRWIRGSRTQPAPDPTAPDRTGPDRTGPAVPPGRHQRPTPFPRAILSSSYINAVRQRRPPPPPAPQTLPPRRRTATHLGIQRPAVLSSLGRRRLPPPPVLAMAGDKTVPRGLRRYPTDPPRHTRHPADEFVLCEDGTYLNPTVESHNVLPKARTRRDVQKRAMGLKAGSYGDAVIVISLSEAEKVLLNSMGSPQGVTE